ncbi:hypothetical protein A5727_13470 [Mycobacterium sp. ACS4331]|nr:hypothetical protein A5727_13470 [Mycobacterium sp. ACS4331]
MLRQGWWILTVAALAGVIVGVVASSHTARQYTATTRLFISATGGNSSSEAFSGGQFAEQRAQSYAQIITSEQMAQRVVDDLGLPMSAEALSQRLNAAIVPRTVLIDVSAKDSSADRAADIANSLARAFIGYVQPLETPTGQSTPRSMIAVVSPAEAPLLPSSPNVVKDVAYGLIGGLAVGLLALVAMRTLSGRITSADELGRISGGPALGPITTPEHGTDVGRHRLVDWVPEEAEQLRRLRVQVEAHDPPPQVLMVAPASAGDAAASVGVGLALAFAETGGATAIVSVDHTHPLSRAGGKQQWGLAELLQGKAMFEQIGHGAAAENLLVVPPGRTTDLEALLSSGAMSAFLDDLRKECDRVVIITPPVIDSSAATVLSAVVDAELLVVDGKRTRRGQVDRAIGELRAARSHLLAVVLSR